MSEWEELDNNEIEIVDIDTEVSDIEEVSDVDDAVSAELGPQNEWGNLSDEEMERRGEELSKRIEMETALRHMRLDDLKNGEYEKDLLEPGEELQLEDEDITGDIETDITDEMNENQDVKVPSDLERLKAFRELVAERDPEICAILEHMNDSTDEEPPQKVLKLR